MQSDYSTQILDTDLSGNGEINFSIDEETEAISLNWANNPQFFMVYLFSPDGRLCGQIMGAAEEGTRTISVNRDYTSACCSSLNSRNEFLGDWRLEYAVFGKSPDDMVNFSIRRENIADIKKNPEQFDIVEGLFSKKVKENGHAGEKTWYAGDFHTHTIYSDGKMSREENNEVAERQNLDFYVATDHNVFHYTWSKVDGITVFPGTEITSGRGHINLLFSQKTPFEKHKLYEIEQDSSLVNIIKETREYALASVNHPFMPPWDFKFESFPLELVKIMEIINDPTYHTAKQATKDALTAWNCLLNDGYNVVGIGGSDSHLKPEEKNENSEYPSLLGDPKTCLFAESKTAQDLKKALISGDVFVTRGEKIIMDFGNLQRQNGDFSGEITVEGFLGQESFHGSKLHFCWILDGKTEKTEKSLKSKFQAKIDKNYHWLRIDVKDDEDNLYGFTNPVFFNAEKKTPAMRTWKDLMEKMKNED